jgi:hypothetical protein
MNPAVAVVLKSLKPAIMAKAIKTFDRHAMLMISVSWAVTIVVMFFALYTINLSVSAKKEAEAAIATEPILPKIIRGGVGGKELQTMIDRLQRRYPEIRVTWQNNVLSIAGANGGVYHQWLTAIGQVDTLYPQYHWRIQGMCVGKICTGNDIMVIDLVGEKIAFEMPQIDEKN